MFQEILKWFTSSKEYPEFNPSIHKSCDECGSGGLDSIAGPCRECGGNGFFEKSRKEQWEDSID